MTDYACLFPCLDQLGGLLSAGTEAQHGDMPSLPVSNIKVDPIDDVIHPAASRTISPSHAWTCMAAFTVDDPSRPTTTQTNF